MFNKNNFIEVVKKYYQKLIIPLGCSLLWSGLGILSWEDNSYRVFTSFLLNKYRYQIIKNDYLKFNKRLTIKDLMLRNNEHLDEQQKTTDDLSN